MEVDADLRAYDMLSQHARVADLAAVAWAVMTGAAETREPEVRPERARQAAAERRIGREDAATPFGNALDVLERGPEDDAEEALARALAGHAVAAHPPDTADGVGRAVRELLWLASRTPFDATGLLDRAVGQAADAMWEEIARRMRRSERGGLPALARGEMLVAAAALASSPSAVASRLVSVLAAEASESKLACVLGARSPREPAGSTTGEMAPHPPGSVASALLALSGVSLLRHFARAVMRVALAYKKPAQVSILEDGGVRVRWRTELLGRTLGDHDVLVPRSELQGATRDVRYPALSLYAGLLALAIGTYVGILALADGMHAASVPLIATGLAIVTIGLALDFALSSIVPAARGRCRLVLVPRRGSALCIGAVDVKSADAILEQLARRGRAPSHADS